MNTTIIISVASIAISVISLVYAIFIDRKYNIRVKELEFEKLERESLELKRAHISFEIERVGSKRFLVVSNNGASVARKLQIQLPENESGVVFGCGTKCEYPAISSRQHFKIPFHIAETHETPIEIHYSYTDDEGEKNRSVFVPF